MIYLAQVQKYVQERFHESDGSDRVEDRGFAFYVNTQPREYLDAKDNSKMTIGSGPVVIFKETGDIYSFSSNPSYMFGDMETGIGVNTAKTAEEFNEALSRLKDEGDYVALNPEKLNV